MSSQERPRISNSCVAVRPLACCRFGQAGRIWYPTRRVSAVQSGDDHARRFRRRSADWGRLPTRAGRRATSVRLAGILRRNVCSAADLKLLQCRLQIRPGASNRKAGTGTQNRLNRNRIEKIPSQFDFGCVVPRFSPAEDVLTFSGLILSDLKSLDTSIINKRGRTAASRE
jgi:hypothetical protein